MTNGIDNAIGKLEGKVDLILDEIKTVRIKVDKLETKGCAKGEADREDIVDLKQRTSKLEGTITRAMLILFGSAGTGVGIGELIRAWLEK